MGPQAGVLLVERVVAGHQGQHATRLQGVEGLGEKEVMQGEALPVVVEPEIGEGHIADDGVDMVLGQAGVAEVLDADVVAGVEHAAIRPERRSSSTPMKRMPAGARAMKLPMPQPGSSTVASAAHPGAPGPRAWPA